MADIDQLKKWVMQDWRAQRDYREKCEEEASFEAGHQWSVEEEEWLKSEQRIPIVFNRVQPIIASVAGLEINNRTEVHFIPREIGDVKPNEILNAAAQWFRDQASAEEYESEAFRDLLISGLGWTETSMDFEIDPEGEPRIERIDPCEMGWDCFARRRGLTDSRRFFRVHKMDRAEAEEQFPDADAGILDADWLGETDVEPGVDVEHSGDEYAFAEDTDKGDSDKDQVRIVQLQWRERVEMVAYREPNIDGTETAGGKDEHLTAEAFDRAMAALGEDGASVPHRRYETWRWRQAYLGSDILLENEPDPYGCTFVPMTGMWDPRDKRFYGLLRIMMDPQKYANKWLSLMLHMVGAAAKGGVMVETGAVVDIQDFEEGYAAADSVVWLKKGGAQKIAPKPTTPMPPTIMALTEFAVSSIRDVSGINLEIMGMREAQQAGVLEWQRRQSAMTTIARFFDALRLYRKRQGLVVLHFLRNHIAPTGRLVRILKEGQEQYAQLAMDDETLHYDAIVEDAPTTPDQKEKTWSVLQEMLPLLMQANLSLSDWADVLEYSPLPSSFIDRLREKAEQEDTDQPDPQQQAEIERFMLENKKLMAEIEKLQSEAMENEAEAQRDLASAALDTARARGADVDTQLKPIETAEKIRQADRDNQLKAAQAITRATKTPPAT